MHSVFARACNVVLGEGRLLTLAHASAGNLPGGLLLAPEQWAAFAARAPVPGDAVCLSREAIVFPRQALALPLACVPVWQPALAVDRLSDPQSLRARLRAAKACFCAEDAARASESCAHGEAAGRRLIAALATGDPEAIGEAVAGLVGLGPGLTPAGDDFLVGALLAGRVLAASGESSAAARFWPPLAEAVARQADRTTDVGRSYLLYATEGAFAEAPLAFVRGLLAREEGWRRWAPRLRAFGATSGVDLARGALAVLELVLA